jgi:hypothetical protein
MRSFGVLSIALALTILLATQASGQSASASINVSGQVSEAVFVSIAPAAQLSGETLPFTHSNLNPHTVRLSISTSTSGGRISIPLQLRSNVGYTLSASANLNGKMLSGLCVAGVRATGKYVARGAVNANNMAACEDATKSVQRRDAKRSGFSSPAKLLQGQSISLNGTSDSPFNALEVLILLDVETQTHQPQGNIELILSAAPERVAAAVLK